MSRSNPTRARGLAAAAIVAAALAAPALAQQPRDPATLSPAAIRGIQHSLIQGGYGVRAADGVWGPDTADALRAFQRVKGLPATGRPDSRTMAALGVGPDGAMPASATTTPAPAPRALTPADLDATTIRAIQQALTRHGVGTGAADGVWGERTRTSIARFQRTRGMPASGELDAHTLAALGLLPDAPTRPAARADGASPSPATLDPAAVRLIQQALKSRGADLGVDGQWGERTADALRAFQRTQGLEPLGEPDVYTLAALGLLPGGLRQVSSR